VARSTREAHLKRGRVPERPFSKKTEKVNSVRGTRSVGVWGKRVLESRKNKRKPTMAKRKKGSIIKEGDGLGTLSRRQLNLREPEKRWTSFWSCSGVGKQGTRIKKQKYQPDCGTKKKKRKGFQLTGGEALFVQVDYMAVKGRQGRAFSLERCWSSRKSKGSRTRRARVAYQ